MLSKILQNSVLVIVMSFGLPVYGTVWYVDDDGDVGGACTSWPDACPDLQTALNLATDGDDIWVAVGTYTPAGPGGDRNATFQLKNGVAIYGGFNGTESALQERADLFDATILSGDLNNNDGPQLVPEFAVCMGLPPLGPECAPLDFNSDTFVNTLDLPQFMLNNQYDENSYHVVTGSDTNGTARLDGFTITAGNSSVSGGFNAWGPAMYSQNGSPTVANCTFSGNAATGDTEGGAGTGGGMANIGFSSPTVSNCTFSGNASVSGGGIACLGGSPTITNCTFSANGVEAHGGGLWTINNANDLSSPTVTGCSFSDQVSSSGAGIYHGSGGTLILTDCTFTHNQAWSGGGALRVDHGSSGGTVQLVDCQFVENSAPPGQGGAINYKAAALTMTGCTFSDHSGGALVSNSSGAGGASLTATDCVFAGNTSSGQSGGAARVGSASFTGCEFTANTGSEGGAIALFGGGPLTMTDCTLQLNVSMRGGAVYGEGIMTLANCNFLNNTAVGSGNGGGGAVSATTGTLTMTNCALCGNSALEPSSYGGAILLDQVTAAHLTHCTIGGNSAAASTFAAGIVVVAIFETGTLTNSIVWGNSGGAQIHDPGALLTVSYSDVQGGWAGTGNIDDDPLFVCLALGDCHLQPCGSPCIDAADNDALHSDTADLDADGDTLEEAPFDLDGNPRRVDDLQTADTGNAGSIGLPIVDMGAYEFQDESHTCCPTDFNLNGQTEAADLALLLGGWGSNPEHPADLTCDGEVNAADLALLLGAWGPCP